MRSEDRKDELRRATGPIEPPIECLKNWTDVRSDLSSAPLPEPPYPTTMGSIVEPQPTLSRQFTCKGWNVDEISSKIGFEKAPRVSALDREQLMRKIDEFEKTGIPLVVQDFHKLPQWKQGLFNPQWLVAQNPTQEISVRDVHSGEDSMIRLDDFLEKSRQIPKFVEPGERERLYGKDAPCPDEWNQWLKSGAIPPRLLADSQWNLLTHLPKAQQVETLMCYIGVGDTFTPIHKDLCASTGQNLMCYTEPNSSSLWFMTESSAARQLTDYFLTHKQVQLDHETHIMTLEEAEDAVKKAQVKMYVVDQRLGDLVLVPPRSFHQVVNIGGITIKTSWSRMTLKGLQTALFHELPLYRRVCRSETYRVKATIYYSIKKWTEDLRPGKDSSESLAKSLAIMLKAFDTIIQSEYTPDQDNSRLVKTVICESPSQEPEITCDFCGADIFHAFFYCKECVSETVEAVEDGLTLCAGCYVEGRRCKCRRSLRPAQLRPFECLLETRRAGHRALKAFWSCRRSMKPIQLTPEKKLLDAAAESGLFAAAILLLNIRLNMKEETKKCSAQAPAHDIPGEAQIPCADCHRSRCFWHYLNTYRMHAVQVLHARCRPESFHVLHGNSRVNFYAKKDQYAQQQLDGSMPEDSIQLADLSLIFTTCKPLCPKFTTSGWYDEDIVIVKSKKRKGFFIDCVFIETPPKPTKTKNSRPARESSPVYLEEPRKRRRIAGFHDSNFTSDLAKAIDSSGRNSAAHEANHKRKRAKIETVPPPPSAPSSSSAIHSSTIQASDGKPQSAKGKEKAPESVPSPPALPSIKKVVLPRILTKTKNSRPAPESSPVYLEEPRKRRRIAGFRDSDFNSDLPKAIDSSERNSATHEANRNRRRAKIEPVPPPPSAPSSSSVIHSSNLQASDRKPQSAKGKEKAPESVPSPPALPSIKKMDLPRFLKTKSTLKIETAAKPVPETPPLSRGSDTSKEHLHRIEQDMQDVREKIEELEQHQRQQTDNAAMMAASGSQIPIVLHNTGVLATSPGSSRIHALPGESNDTLVTVSLQTLLMLTRAHQTVTPSSMQPGTNPHAGASGESPGHGPYMHSTFHHPQHDSAALYAFNAYQQPYTGRSHTRSPYSSSRRHRNPPSCPRSHRSHRPESPYSDPVFYEVNQDDIGDSPPHSH